MIIYLPLALLVAAGYFTAFRIGWPRSKSKLVRAVLLSTACVLAVPAALFSSYYVLHWPEAVWYVNFRSVPGAEALSGLVGGALGIAYTALWRRLRLLSGFFLALATATAILLLIAPFGKQLLFRLDSSKLEEQWVDGVCKQTCLSTCVPASCATVVHMLGGTLTEREIAVESGTTLRGTEIWYAKRALRRYGYDLQPGVAKSVGELPAPSVVGVMVGDSGHVVVLMSKDSRGPEIGDPLGLRRRYTWREFEARYRPKLMYFEIRGVSGGS